MHQWSSIQSKRKTKLFVGIWKELEIMLNRKARLRSTALHEPSHIQNLD
jgi:hypothetical protein